MDSNPTEKQLSYIAYYVGKHVNLMPKEWQGENEKADYRQKRFAEELRAKIVDRLEASYIIGCLAQNDYKRAIDALIALDIPLRPFVFTKT